MKGGRPKSLTRKPVGPGTVGGFFGFLKEFAARRFGPQGTEGRGKWHHATKAGPGRRPVPLADRVHPAGTKLVRSFIRGSGRESTHWRRVYHAMTGKPYPT